VVPPDYFSAKGQPWGKRPAGGSSEAVLALMRLACRARDRPAAGCINLGAEARMNVPGRAADNWRWRCPEDMLSAADAERLRDLTEASNRRGGLRTDGPRQQAGSPIIG